MDILKIFLDSNYNFCLFANKWVLLGLIVIPIIYFLFRVFGRAPFSKTFEIDEAELGVGNQKIKIKPNYEDMQIAYKLWIEISTRKIGVPIDFKNDVLYEVYNSWYDFFRIARELIKMIPVRKIRKYDSSQKIVDLSISILNDLLRPHLTLWQAKFRKWYKEALNKEKYKEDTPQEIQEKYPSYKQLIKDMKEVNKALINYREVLKKLAFEK